MNSVGKNDQNSIPKTPKPNMTNYLRSLPTTSFTHSPWIGRGHQSRSSTSETEHSAESLSKSKFSSSESLQPPSAQISNKSPRNNKSFSNLCSPSSSKHVHELASSSLGERNLTTISRTASISNSNDVVAVPSQGEGSEVDDESESQIVLAICWCHEKLGAAFYDASTSQAYVMADKSESAPEFWTLRNLFRETEPKVLLMGGKQDQRLFKVINELRGLKDTKETPEGGTEGSASEGSLKRKSNDEASSVTEGEPPSSGSASSAPGSSGSRVTLSIRPASEFKYDTCRRRVFLFPWPGLTRQSADLEKEAWVRSKVDLESVAAVRALGGLLRFLEQKGNELLSRNSLFRGTPVLGLHSYRMEDLVHVDEAAISFLQVFSEDLHPASSKSGKSSSSKEGLSLFALLSRTASPLAPNVLRRVILRPVRNPQVLLSRYDFLSWATQPANLDTIRQIQNCLKNIANVQMLFSRLQKSQLNVSDWKKLYKSLFNMILLSEICAAQDSSIDAIREVKESACSDLYHATYLIQQTLDFDQADREGRFVVKPGLDSDLDDKKRKFSSIGDMMHKVAQLELCHLPPEVSSCCVIYLPHIGYLLAIPPSAPLDSFLTKSTVTQGNTTIINESYDIPGLQFMFRTSDMVLFKSPMCANLDNEMGDLEVEIANRETSVLIRLVKVLLQHSHAFVSLVSKALFLDVLLAFASVSRDLGWTRPSLTSSGNLRVKEGRHPLYEVTNPTFVSNDVIGDLDRRPVSLLTGPNASGKTAFLKQVGVLAYLAHLGCFVPAEEMTFRPFDTIATVAVVTPSVTSGLSTFMVELNRLVAAVCGSTRHSLVLIDEFGSSTYDLDGASLLAATLAYWTSQEVSGAPSTPPAEEGMGQWRSRAPQPGGGCPLVFVSTHFSKLHLHLKNSDRIRELCMDTMQEGEKVVPLYQVVEGRTRQNYALQVAQSAGLPGAIIKRAKEVNEALTSSSVPPRWGPLYNSEERKRCADIVEMFLNYDITSVSLSELFTSLRKYLLENSLDSTNDSMLLNPADSLVNPPPPPSAVRSHSSHNQVLFSPATEAFPRTSDSDSGVVRSQKEALPRGVDAPSLLRGPSESMTQEFNPLLRDDEAHSSNYVKEGKPHFSGGQGTEVVRSSILELYQRGH